MGALAASPIAMELRHNDEAVGRVFAGAVEVHDDEEVQHAQARFWHGLRGVRRVALSIPAFHAFLPGPRSNLVLLVVR
jgi:hypothetical protein